MVGVNYASIKEIHQMYKDEKLTVRELVLSYMEQIAAVDSCKDGLNSVLEINPDALHIASEMDERLTNADMFNDLIIMEPMFGIPVLIKDNINTGDKMRTSAGSLALDGNYAPFDAEIVENLRNAGALILGKVNMTEWANYMTKGEMPSGYSSRGGQVLNPYNGDETPSGSSSGSGVAVAAGLCAVSVGTETSGSIISPSAANGIVGIKPTKGLISGKGVIPISNTMDTAGPMARSVADAAVLLGALAGEYEDYTEYLQADGLKGVKIGIVRYKKKESDEERDENVVAAFESLLKTVTDAGAVLVDNVVIEEGFAPVKIMHYEFKACLNYYLSTQGGSTKIRSLNDVILFNQVNSKAALKYGQDRLLESENNASGRLTDPEYIKEMQKREEMIKHLDKVFDENGLDVLLFESFPMIAPYTGFPSLTVPLGQRKNGVPIGSNWVARRFDEKRLIKIGYSAEQKLGVKLRPEF